MRADAILLGLLLSIVPNAGAMTLQDYGVSLVSDGIVDHISGLRWLDADLNAGPPDNLQPYLDSGWRIARQSEFNFLIRRESDANDIGFAGVFPVDGDEAAAMLENLGFRTDGDPIAEFDQPWLCRDFSSATDCSIDAFNFVVLTLAEFSPMPDSAYLAWTGFLSEYQLYCISFGKDCNNPMGRTLLVRNVPLPAAWLLLLSAAVALRMLPRQFTAHRR